MRFLFVLAALTAAAADYQSAWPAKGTRVWAGPEYWTNPLQDWRVADGRLECIVAGGDRNAYLLTREISARPQSFTMSVRLGRLDPGKPLQAGFVGFRLGVRGSFNDYRDSALRGLGLNAGIAANGRLFIGSLPAEAPRARDLNDTVLTLEAEPVGGLYRLRLRAGGAEVTRDNIKPEWLTGGVALVCHSGPVETTPVEERVIKETGWEGKRLTQRGGTLRFWFRDWQVKGPKIDANEKRAWGPVLFTMYTLNRGVLKLTAQLAPADDGERELHLQAKDGANWKTVARAERDALARTATFRVAGWNDKRDTPYRVVYRWQGKEWSREGTIRHDPVEKPRIVAAAFTGNNDLGFPHNDIVKSVAWHKPDFLIYTGDQIYERVGEYGIQRAPLETATLDYLRKWYLFGWEYAELLKDIPSVALPDDHDVYHGNLWGAGGRHSEGEGYAGQDPGGYTMPAEWVNMVQRTQTAHMADAYDPTPVDQGISVYYGPMLWGGVSFAVVEDRKWKSAPQEMLPQAGILNGWSQKATYNAARDGAVRGAQLLGARQEAFLEKWAADWSGGAWMKAVISQTIFANVATLPDKERMSDAITPKLRVMKPAEWPPDDLPVADHDSNGWPQTGRNTALRAMRRGLAFHIAGDQHLGSTVQYGVEEWGDAAWALCVPSVANVWPRRWYPPAPGRNAKPGAPRYTGEYRDGFGNQITVAAVSNPVDHGVEPLELMRRAPGYGIVEFERATRKIHIANWPRWVDATQPGAKPYPGWPIVIDQLDNGMPRKGLRLPALEWPGHANAVVQVKDEVSSEVIYTVRVNGRQFTAQVPRQGVYTVRFFNPDKGGEQIYRGQRAVKE